MEKHASRTPTFQFLAKHLNQGSNDQYIHLDSLVSELLGDICEPAPLLDKLLGDVIPGSSSIPLCPPLCEIRTTKQQIDTDPGLTWF